MRAADIRAKGSRRYRITTNSNHDTPVAPNELDRQFAVEQQPGPDRVWVADITYIPTREGWLYLAILLDLATRRIVGWSVRSRLDQELTLGALRMALRHRRPPGGLRCRRAERRFRMAAAATRCGAPTAASCSINPPTA